MKKIIIFTYILTLSIHNQLYSNELNCDEHKKFSVNYMKCKANLLKNKTINAKDNFVKDTKDYQKKEWSEEKEKVENTKKKVLGQ
tara:strand:- start:266 stop:520 length:255 start_codon:yes stop_codon:yes gene_type:complete